MNKEHTKLPWVYAALATGIGNDTDHFIEAHPSLNGEHAIAEIFGPDREANAEFIVLACNSHERLRRALDAIANWNIDVRPGHCDYMSRADIKAFAQRALDESNPTQ